MSVELRQAPHRHYAITNPVTGKTTWHGADKQRVVSVTTMLDPDGGALVNWAVGRTTVAAEAALQTWFPGTAAQLASSAVDFPGMMALSGEMPDTVRDEKAAIGAAAHEYLACRLGGSMPACLEGPWYAEGDVPVPYGLRVAIEDFLNDCGVEAVSDEHGPRVERAVGSFRRALAGTYDAQADMVLENGMGTRCRIDLKTSNTIQPRHWAQIAEYERLAVDEHGEDPSEFLCIVHADVLGGYKVHSIGVGSPAHATALRVANAYLTIHRGEAALAKLLR